MNTRTIARKAALCAALALVTAAGLVSTMPTAFADCGPMTGSGCKKADPPPTNPKSVDTPIAAHVMAVSPLIRLLFLGW